MTTQPKQLTADDFLRLHSQGVRGELIRGVLHETMPAGREHGKIAAKLSFLLGCSVWPRRLGDLTTSDSAVWLEPRPGGRGYIPQRHATRGLRQGIHVAELRC